MLKNVMKVKKKNKYKDLMTLRHLERTKHPTTSTTSESFDYRETGVDDPEVNGPSRSRLANNSAPGDFRQ